MQSLDTIGLTTTSSSEVSLHVTSGVNLSLPYPVLIPKDCVGFVLQFIQFSDSLFPRRISFRHLTGSFCNRIWTMRSWSFWCVCTGSLLSFFFMNIGTLAWLADDPHRAAVKPLLYLGFISLIWSLEQAFCVTVRPLIPLRSMQGYIRDWSPMNSYIPKLFVSFALIVYAGNVGYGLFSTLSSLVMTKCIPLQQSSFSYIYQSIMNCTASQGFSADDKNNIVGSVGAWGQGFVLHPIFPYFVSFIYFVATFVWTTTPLQFAVIMLMSIKELRSAMKLIDSELFERGDGSHSVESVLQRLHAHVVAADIGSCRCNEVFGIIVVGNLFLDLSLIAILLSALQDPLYQQNTVLLPVTAFWMSASCLHICAFLLPMAAYNSSMKMVQIMLYRYSARLNGLTTPPDNLDAWAKPLQGGLLKRLHHKVI
jgi:hypothetical protein